MSYFDRIQRAVDFIEDNLTGPVTLEDVAKEACFSLYHFHRIFHCITGTSLKEYIRKRRLSEALKDVITTNDKIIGIAFRYQYDAPETFSRAFKREFGLSPIQYRNQKSNSRYFLPFKLNKHTFVKGDVSMEPAIKTISSFNVAGYKLETTSIDGRNFKEIPPFWQKILSNDCAALKRIRNIVNPHISYGICTNMKKDGSFTYIIGCEVSRFDNAEDGIHCETIPDAMYAVFTSKGTMPQSIQSTARYIYGTWFPESGYEPAGSPDFELYDSTRMKDPKSAECDICIPIKKVKS